MQRLVLLVLMLQMPSLMAAETLFRLHGSNTVGATLAPALVESWLEREGYQDIRRQEVAPQEVDILANTAQGREVRVELQAHGSSTGFRSLKAGKADMSMASRPIKDKEFKALAHMGDLRSPASEHVVGLDGIAVIVHKSNPVSRLDKATIKAIFTGEIRDWQAIGGRPGPIHVLARDDNSGTYDTFKSLVIGKKTPLIENARRFESNAELSRQVSADRYAIGFVGLPYVLNSKALSTHDGETLAIRPEEFTVATEDYLLSRRLFFYVPQKNPNPFAADFAEFVHSAAAQDIVAEVGFVSQRISSRAVADRSHFPHEYAGFVEGAERLSLNFRFRSGSIRLDNKALKDVQRLVEYMRSTAGKGKRVMLFGFADNDEALPIHSLTLSVDRADAVARALSKVGISPVRVRGYGSELPVASNATEKGREKNRRVEVWVM